MVRSGGDRARFGDPARLSRLSWSPPRMGIPLRQQIKVGAYILRQHLAGRRRYPLVLMLEPLFRCNPAFAGCGKIDYPDPILNRRLSPRESLEPVGDGAAPGVAIAGAEP